MDDVEWDADKAAANLEKHGVDFADAATVLHDEQAIIVKDEAGAEERFVPSAWTPSHEYWWSRTRGGMTGRV